MAGFGCEGGLGSLAIARVRLGKLWNGLIFLRVFLGRTRPISPVPFNAFSVEPELRVRGRSARPVLLAVR